MLATDPAAVRDFQAFCEADRLSWWVQQQAGEFTFLLRKAMTRDPSKPGGSRDRFRGRAADLS